jgi:hypothetical protein
VAVARIIRGFDLDRLQSHSAAHGADGNAEANAALAYATRFAEQYQMPTPIDSLPLQDAIECTEYLGEVACGYDRFKLGPTGVGDDLDVLVLRPDAREWVCRKSIHAARLTR